MNKKPLAKRSVLIVPFEELAPLIKECIGAGKSAQIYPRGVSMRPLIREGKDSVTLSPAPARLQVNDMALFSVGDRYLLHRVVAVLPNGAYVFCGDNGRLYERGVPHAAVLAVVSEIKRAGKSVRLAGWRYRAYLRLVTLRRRARRFCMRLLGQKS